MNVIRSFLVSHAVIILFGLFVSIYLDNPAFLLGILGGLLVGAIVGPRMYRDKAMKKLEN